MDEKYGRSDLMLFDYAPEDLRAMRKRIGLSQKDVGRIFDIHPVTVCQWESGKVNNPLVLQMYGIFLERYYARMNGYVPAFRKLGENELISAEEIRNGTQDLLQSERAC